MKTWIRLIVLLGMTASIAAAQQSYADEAAGQADADEARLRRIKELLDQSVDWYDVLPEAQAKAGMRPQVVLRWQNAERINTGAALLAIWTDQGRPEAMASIFQNGNDICHEFGLLSRSKKIVIRDNARVLWSPGKGGVEFRDMPDVPAPADDRAARLRQMKSLAERFTARLPAAQFGNGNPEMLRLLPRPLYRYALRDVKDASPMLRDGAMFAFVTGTDPEVILLLEAVEREDKVIWQYALARATAYAVEASLDDKVVWSVSVQSARDPGKSLKQFFRPIPPSP